VAAVGGCLLTAACFGSGGDDRAAASAQGSRLAAETAAAVGAYGIGDPYYPEDGNRGYDVDAYSLDLDYYPEARSIRTTASIRATADKGLRRFSLDLLGLTVTRVRVDGQPAGFDRRRAHELVIRPSRAIRPGRLFTVDVDYHGTPADADLGDAVDSGWFDADTPGAGFIAGEPHSCTLWYPCNDHPTDKATFELRATVPRPFAVVSNGVQLPTEPSQRANGDAVRTFHWRLDEPTATYLTTIYVDRIQFDRSTLPGGIPVVSAYGPDAGRARQREAKLPEILRVLSARWGPYPAPAAGGIFVDGDVPFSLETFTRPTFSRNVGVSTIVHENAHQWWGDNVSIERWRDICLNECLASYSQWLWLEHRGADLDEMYRRAVEQQPDFFDFPLYDMGAGHEFDFEGVYAKGTFFVHALRNEIGDDAFFAAMREIQAEHAGGNLSMDGLRDLLEQKTGVDLAAFWNEWVLSTGVPSDENLYPGDLGS
jgi:aminopeptidase N